MISVNEAKDIINNKVVVLPSIKLSIEKTVGFVLAEDVFSTIDYPPFHQSSVDGYAFAFDDVQEKLFINGEVPAGNKESLSLLPKHAMRIFTGAAIPSNADTVVMQEKTIIEDDKLIIKDEQLKQGINFRPAGSDIKAGEPALLKNSVLFPAAIGFLAAIGITDVVVYKNPSVNIITTGNELQQPGNPLQFGQVYEANSYMLKAALQQLGINDVNIFFVDDNLQRLTAKLNEALQSADIVLLTGGVSVGDYDFVLQAAVDCNIEKLFHKVKQRPGKPLYFGKKENKIVFGLPGNPSSVLSCFYEYVIPALEIMVNRKYIIKTLHLPLAKDYKKIAGLTFFLKGIYNNDKAIPLDAQASYQLSSFAKANCLIRLEEEITEYNEGDIVEVHVLPN